MDSGKGIDSFEFKVKGELSNVVGGNAGESSSVQRRFSPRLHKGSKMLQEVCDDAITVCQVERRCSPRLRRNYVINEGVETSKISGAESRQMSRFCGSQVKEKQIIETQLQNGLNPKNQKEETFVNTPAQSRLSPGIHIEQKDDNQETPQEIFVGHKRPITDSDQCSAKRSINGDLKDECKVDFECSYVNDITSTSNGDSPQQLTSTVKACANKAMKQGEAVSSHARVKETLRLFNTYYLQFVQESEEKQKQNQDDNDKTKKAKASSSKEKDPRSPNRPDLKAFSKMKAKNEILYPEKMIGDLPGIDVGYQFYSRCEMAAIGFHSHWLNGIDYIGQVKSKKREDLQKYNLPIAVAVVMSGQYEDDIDNVDDVVYTGQGGHDLLGSKLQQKDQKLVGGNLALKNSMDQSVPIRVIRGHRNIHSYSGKIYSYGGLYKVSESWADNGCRGHLVYKYRLQRLQGQPKLTTDQVQFVRGCPLKTISELPGLVCRDISNGIEQHCIPVTNVVDDPPICPPEFTYIKSIEVADSVKLPANANGCSCKGNCSNPNTCACAKLNGPEFPYVGRDGGRLVEAKDVVFECGPNCGCKPGCLNRVSQREIKYRLEVYRTPNKGWAVRSWDYIPSGAPVCEYIGVLRRSDELDNIAGNEYIFEIDCLHTINEIEGRERRFGNVNVSPAITSPNIDKKTLDGTPEFCIDAGSRGNVARFINHSCQPNLFVQCILSVHHDLRLARVVLIAADNISPMQELTYDYGYALDSVVGSDGKIQVLPCFCGAPDCRKRLY
ncbi:unnamed protein product [Amaranthus hypochondriacus]